MELSTNLLFILLVISTGLCSGGRLHKWKGSSKKKGENIFEPFKPLKEDIMNKFQNGIDWIDSVRNQEESPIDNNENAYEDIDEGETTVTPRVEEIKPTENLNEEFLSLIYKEFKLVTNTLDEAGDKVKQARRYISKNFAVALETLRRRLVENMSDEGEKNDAKECERLCKKISKYMERRKLIAEFITSLKVWATNTALEFLDHVDTTRRNTAKNYWKFTNNITLDVTFAKKTACKELHEIGEEVVEEMRNFKRRVSTCNQIGLTELYKVCSTIKDVLRKLVDDSNDSYKIVQKCGRGEDCSGVWTEEYNKMKRIGSQAVKDIAFDQLKVSKQKLVEFCVDCFAYTIKKLIDAEKTLRDDIKNCLAVVS